MSLEFNDRMLALWFVEMTPEVNFLGALYRTDDGRFEHRARFNYKFPCEVHGYHSAQNWHSYISRDDVTEEEAMKIAHDAAQLLVRPETPEPVYELLRGDKSTEDLKREFMSQPFALDMQLIGSHLIEPDEEHRVLN